jgi:hypothetical protein
MSDPSSMGTLKLRWDYFLFGVSLIALLSSVRVIAQTVPTNPNDIPVQINEYVAVPPPPTPISANDPMQSPKAQLSALRHVNEALSRYQAHPQQGSSDDLARLAKMMLQVTGAREVIRGAWITSAKLITYRSSRAQILPNGPRPDVARTCALTNSSHPIISDNAAEFVLVYANCSFDLNDRLDFARQPRILKMDELARGRPAIWKVTFVGVKLTNNLSLPLIDFHILECVGCIFDIKPAEIHPSAEQQFFIRTLLQDDPRYILLYGKAVRISSQ